MSKHEAPEIGAMVERMLRALARRAGAGEAEAVEQLARLEGVVGEQLRLGVNGYRGGPAEASWTEVAELLGTSRQAAHRRFSCTGCSCACHLTPSVKLGHVCEMPA